MSRLFDELHAAAVQREHVIAGAANALYGSLCGNVLPAVAIARLVTRETTQVVAELDEIARRRGMYVRPVLPGVCPECHDPQCPGGLAAPDLPGQPLQAITIFLLKKLGY